MKGSIQNTKCKIENGPTPGSEDEDSLIKIKIKIKRMRVRMRTSAGFRAKPVGPAFFWRVSKPFRRTDPKIRKDKDFWEWTLHLSPSRIFGNASIHGPNARQKAVAAHDGPRTRKTPASRVNALDCAGKAQRRRRFRTHGRPSDDRKPFPA